MSEARSDRFEMLSQMARAATRGDSYQQIAQSAVEQAAGLVGLNAAAVLLWDDNQQLTLQVAHADSDPSRERLMSLEEDLVNGLRRNQRLMSAYLSFDGNPPQHFFTMPLKYRDRVFGAVIGMQQGEKTVVGEDDFLETFSALIALNVAAGQPGTSDGISQEDRDKERLSAVVETAVTVNHEINNPLTAILGNVQLLLLKREDLDDDLKKKLKTIEESAMKIKTVTQRLMNLKSARSVEYSEGTQMLDISDDETES